MNDPWTAVGSSGWGETGSVIAMTCDDTWSNNSIVKSVGTGVKDGLVVESDENGNDGACFNCGETGHQKNECPNPRVFTGACRLCNMEGHMAKDCPEAGPVICRRCGEEGHIARECPQPQVCQNCGEHGHTTPECKGARKVDRSKYAGMTADDAWELMVKAVSEKDMDDIKEAVQIYLKAEPRTTYPELEDAFRSQDIKLWLIAIEKPHLAATFTNMDFQGNLEKTFTVTYRFDPKPPRPREREFWPRSAEENMERLKDAGEVVERGIPKCHNCDEMGHTSRICSQEKRETQNPMAVKCYNCDGEGHRVRDCPNPRVSRFACNNCGRNDHRAADCPEPRSAADIECHKCGEVGHFSRDCPRADTRQCHNCGEEGHFARECPEPKNRAKMQCRNCDEFGHEARECPKPRGMSRIKCSKCQEMGHFMSKCPHASMDENDDGGSPETIVNTAEDANTFGDDDWGISQASLTDSAW